MGQWTEEVNNMPATPVAPGLSKMLTLEQVQEILNVKSSLVYALVRSGELPAGQLGGHGRWRVGRQHVEDYIEEAYWRTADRIAAGEISDGGETGDPE